MSTSASELTGAALGWVQDLVDTFPIQTAVDQFAWLTLGYFLALNAGYLLLMALATRQEGKNERTLSELPLFHSDQQVPVSILVPAFNEAVTIVSSIRSLLQLFYGEYEVIVVNDGSQDDTLTVLQREFQLIEIPVAHPCPIPTQAVNHIYQSLRQPRLRVIDKVRGGKADSLNAGINFSRFPLFCGVDADSVLERDSLHRVVHAFMRDPTVVAAGGTVRVANGCAFTGGHLTNVSLPVGFLPRFQLVEYVRSFFLARLGWSSINGVLIISGAFGVFRKSVVVAAGGYRPQTIGEDMELVVRIHRFMRAKKQTYRIVFVPEAVCWTEAPEDFRTLRNQRIRWQRGLAESLTSNWGLMFSANGGVPGHVAFPFMLLFEFAGPLLEFTGYVAMTLFWLFGWLSWEVLSLFLLVAVGLGVFLSLCGLLLEEMTFHLYSRRQLLELGLVAVLENFGYRQLDAYWRLVGLFRWLRQGDAGWGTMTRRRTLQSAP